MHWHVSFLVSDIVLSGLPDFKNGDFGKAKTSTGENLLTTPSHI
jgi:hypothetical protein